MDEDSFTRWNVDPTRACEISFKSAQDAQQRGLPTAVQIFNADVLTRTELQVRDTADNATVLGNGEIAETDGGVVDRRGSCRSSVHGEAFRSARPSDATAIVNRIAMSIRMTHIATPRANSPRATSKAVAVVSVRVRP